MFMHHKELAYTVRVDKPNPVYGRMLQEAIGGPAGEMRVMNQYLFQAWGYRGPARYRDMLLATGTEEIGHVEVLATAVAMNLEGPPAAAMDKVIESTAVEAKLGPMEPKNYLMGGGGPMPGDSDGNPFTAACIDLSGNLAANMLANAGAEAVGRTLATRLYELTDDPGMKDMWKFLIARDTMHQQQWLAAHAELTEDERFNAPGDFENEPEYLGAAYSFFNHLADREIDPTARWATGPSLDGKGEFSVVAPPRGNAVTELQKAPPAAHDGPDATNPSADGAGVMGTGGLMDKVKDAVT